jgi:hypothetical protein
MSLCDRLHIYNIYIYIYIYIYNELQLATNGFIEQLGSVNVLICCTALLNEAKAYCIYRRDLTTLQFKFKLYNLSWKIMYLNKYKRNLI